MNTQSYLLFKLNHSCYGILATAVQEIFFLPQMTAIAAVAPGMLGVMNLRGNLLPVVDLYHHLGQVRPPLCLTDNIIVLEWQTQRIGIVVSQVNDVQLIAADQMTTALYHQHQQHGQDGLVAGIATIEPEIVSLLNPEWLIQQTMVQAPLGVNAQTEAAFNNGSVNGKGQIPADAGSDQGLYDHFDPQAQQILQARTAALQGAIATQDAAGLVPLAVVSVGGEYFGFELATVYEFTEVDKITPIPCCPPHIIGNINQRGEIVTLINISCVLDLPRQTARSCPQAVVVRLDQRVAGIAVDEIFDVMYVQSSHITTVPVAMQSTRDDYVRGVVPYNNRMMSIINLSKLLMSDVLVVNEEV